MVTTHDNRREARADVTASTARLDDLDEQFSEMVRSGATLDDLLALQAETDRELANYAVLCDRL